MRQHCCLKYENEVYTDLKKSLPRLGSIVHTKFGDGKVVSLGFLSGECTIELENKTRIVVGIDDCKE